MIGQNIRGYLLTEKTLDRRQEEGTTLPLAGLLGGEEAGHKKIRQLTAIA